jgi:hypothetical protein
LCYEFGTVSAGDNATFDIKCGQQLGGQRVRLEKGPYNGTWTDEYSINMCEFEVYAEIGTFRSCHFRLSYDECTHA